MSKNPLIYCAIDTPDMDQAITWAKTIGPITGGLKLGLEFFNTFGPKGIAKIAQACPDASLFVDLKYHDIPNTVAGAVKTLSHTLRPAYLNVHAIGGLEMMQRARDACHPNTKLLAVTVLTSTDQAGLDETGQSGTPEKQVQTLAALTKKANLDGVVCSALEIKILREKFGDDFILMVPGIRPENTNHGDQKRVMSPRQAIMAGATHLVIGRPITKANDPATAAHEILNSISSK